MLRESLHVLNEGCVQDLQSSLHNLASDSYISNTGYGPALWDLDGTKHVGEQ